MQAMQKLPKREPNMASKKSAPKKKQGNIFDAFVKNVFGRVVVFVEFLRCYANPQFITQLDLKSIHLAPTHLFGKDVDERIVDLVFQCPLKDGCGSLLAVIIFEHQTGSLREIPLKILKFISAIWDAERKAGKPLSAPYFIVLRTGKKPCRTPYPCLADLLPKDKNGKPIGMVPEVFYDVVDLPSWDFEKLIGPPVLRLVLGILKQMCEGVLDEFPKALMPLREFTSIDEQKEWLKDVLSFVAKVFMARHRELASDDVNVAAKTVFGERAKDMKLTIFEELEARGEARGKVASLLRVLTARFNRVPKRVSERISQIGDTVVLDSLTVTAALCTSLAEFEEELK
ncbi:MAG: Rpn family recombination-promoting nuclease/putative transposase [Thermoguttaceae bacterium]